MPSKQAIIQYKNLVSTYPFRGLSFERGEGVELITETGERYLDFMSNFGVNVLGYNHPELNQALHDQLDDLTILHSSFANGKRSEALTKLAGLFRNSGFPDISRFYFSNSGAEAVEAAIKFALVATGRQKIIAPRNDYHGKTFAALSVTTSGEGKYQKPFKNHLLETESFSFLDVDELRSIISEEYAALVIEPIQGEGGIIIPEKSELIEVSRLCRKNGVILIIDEIQTGVGRTGTFLNIQQLPESEFSTDIVCLAKGIGGGIPVGVTCITEEINSKIPKGIQTSTFGGNPLAMTGISATIGIIDNNFLENVRNRGDFFLEELNQLAEKYENIIEVRGSGLMIGLEVDPNLSLKLLKFLQSKKILAAPTSSNTIRFLPPLIIEKIHIEKLIDELNSFFETTN
jgi:acetylornithine/LysW-gamma-L-lysine aminotransferase